MSGLEKLREETSDTKTVIGLLMESKRNCAAGVENGKVKVSLAKTVEAKVD
ncbi:MAG: hypothetical protein ACYTFW_18845 [Planctomycetota bacterium]|jgi:hypothetical protein